MDIIHFMAEQMEIAIQDSGGAYEIHSAGNPSKRGQEHNRPICCMLSYAGVCAWMAEPVYPFPWCYIQLHTPAPGAHTETLV